jgi:flagellar L-ring protein precursor FlgH
MGGAVLSGTAWSDSLYDESTYHSPVRDQRAFRMGDVLTVAVIEQASAQTKANTDTRTNTDVAGSVSGDGMTYKGSFNFLNNYQGGGTISRQGRLLANVTVSVVEVLSGGELKVYGEQRIEVNEEVQNISVYGIVRPQDIGPLNIVPSPRLSSANIRFVGDGLLGRRQSPGLFSWLFDWLF